MSEAALRLDGELTFARVPTLWPTLKPQINATVRTLDLSAVTRVDSAGLAMLVALQGVAQTQSHALVLAGAPAQLLQLARVSGVDALLNFHWATDAADPEHVHVDFQRSAGGASAAGVSGR